MPFVLIVSGVVLLTAAVRNTQQWLFFLLANDFTGKDNFIYWFVSILLIGAIGYIQKLKPLSDGFLILVILVLLLKKGTGFFDMFNKAIGVTQTTQPNVSAPQTASGGGASSGGSSVNLGIPCRPGIDPGCGANGRYGGPGVTPPTVIIGPGAGGSSVFGPGGESGGYGGYGGIFSDPWGFFGPGVNPTRGSDPGVDPFGGSFE